MSPSLKEQEFPTSFSSKMQSTQHLEKSDSADGTASSVNDSAFFTKHRYKWLRIRELLRQPAAEFFGTMILIIFGTGVDCQVVLSSNTKVAASPKGDYLALATGWAVGTALGVWFSAGISGGHINPAVTIALATFRGFPWRKVPVYIFAQLMGALCGAGIVYANYIHAIDLYEGGRSIRTVPGTASLFSTYAAPYMTPVSAWFDEFVGTPLVLFIAVLGIGIALGMQTGYAINPARDFGPRLLTAMVGYGKEVFTFRHQYWLWCPIIGPIVGALVGVFIYDMLIYTGSDSILSRTYKAAAVREAAAEDEPEGPIIGVDEIV
ncbi:aquaporin [Sparassis latifolia]